MRGAGRGGFNRAVDRTIFWNLVVHFREHCLPVTFLLGEVAAGEKLLEGIAGGESHPCGLLL